MRIDGKVLDVAIDAADAAGQAVMKIFNRSRLVVRKKYDYPGSLVTNADFAAERLILRKIRKSGIKSTVLSEEAGTVNFGSTDLVWAVDPLDGTLNYAKRIPYFAVSIGVLLNDRAVAGVIYNPILDEMFVASIGEGAYMNGNRIRVGKAASLDNASLSFEWWNTEPRVRDPLELERVLYRHTRRIRSPGSVALNLCSVASGRFDGLITVFRLAPKFEIGAGCLLIEEAGGRVTNSYGKSWQEYSNSIIAANDKLQRRLMSLLQRQTST